MWVHSSCAMPSSLFQLMHGIDVQCVCKCVRDRGSLTAVHDSLSHWCTSLTKKRTYAVLSRSGRVATKRSQDIDEEVVLYRCTVCVCVQVC